MVESDEAAFVIERGAGRVSLAGHPDLTDYHTPLGSGIASLVAEFVGSLAAGTKIIFDSLPREAAAPIEQGLIDTAVKIEREEHAMAVVLDLPESFDEYLTGLSKKQRHEVRRKLRRFKEALGEPRLVRESGADVVAMFADLHRRSSGEKRAFMSPEMEEYFVTLGKEVGAVIDVLYGETDRPVAAAFSFEDVDTSYLYNSAYEPEVGEASPGIALVAALISNTIARGHTRFDFLKGDEIYKFRLGAVARPLYRLTGVTK